MPLLTLGDISLSLGRPALLDRVALEVQPGERVCLLGRNGEGKTTLLRVIAGEIAPDDGVVRLEAGRTAALLPQTFPDALTGTVFDLVAEGLGEPGRLAATLRQTPAGPARGAIEAELSRLEGWDAERRTLRASSEAELDPDLPLGELSGGQLRRALLARARVGAPDLLLLDEPTNHLDLPAIGALENLVLGFTGQGGRAVIFTTHDRAFMQRLATRILELDRGHITSWPGDYRNYLRRREERLAAERQAVERHDKLLAEEERWIRQGIQARRTRNEGRVRRLEQLRAEARARRTLAGPARLSVQEAEGSGRRVIEARDLSFGYDAPIVRGFSCIVQRGEKVGIVGPNGAGKTTLLRLLLGELTPASGIVRRGTRLETVYFDQRREQLDPSATVVDSVGEGKLEVQVNGRPRHVISYLQDFLFSPDRARIPVSALSGGERNRLLLARLFAKPSNLLVLDEPTNDLDLETLELLEALLVDYRGTVLVVSHDRTFLDSVATSILAFEEDGRVVEHVGGYGDLARAQARQRALKPIGQRSPEPAGDRERKQRAKVRRKLGYREQRELEALPERVQTLEDTVARLQSTLADPETYRNAPERVPEHTSALEAAESDLAATYKRWEALERLATASGHTG